MIVVDASCLYEVVANGVNAEAVRALLTDHDDQAAPHVVDVEVLGLVRRDALAGRLDPTAAGLAVDDLRAWPGERFGHRGLLERAWELQPNIRTWDGVYVALAEVLDAPLLTLDRRLARAKGPRCSFVIPA
ncbi:MAG: type II toxin-antitoxin system VapC family toxin [Acidimicrobiales bacterium]